MGGAAQGATALELGCGRGVGTELVLDVFGAAHVDAFDLDPEMVRAWGWPSRSNLRRDGSQGIDRIAPT